MTKKTQRLRRKGLLRSRRLKKGQWTAQITCGVRPYFYESHSLETVLVSGAFPDSCTVLPCFLCHHCHSWQESTVSRRTTDRSLLKIKSYSASDSESSNETPYLFKAELPSVSDEQKYWIRCIWKWVNCTFIYEGGIMTEQNGVTQQNVSPNSEISDNLSPHDC